MMNLCRQKLTETMVEQLETMLKNNPNIGADTLTMQNNPRVLPIVVFLRKTKINELPQLFNTLFGGMSIVGPRPLAPEGEVNYNVEVSN